MNNNGNQNANDVIVSNCPSEGISSLNFSPNANVMIAGCWDGKVYCWEIGGKGQTQAKAALAHQAPVLCTDFHNDGSQIFSGTCDNKVPRFVCDVVLCYMVS